MVQAWTILMGSLLFALGLVLGLVFQLPGTSSPSLGRHPRDLQHQEAPSNGGLDLEEISLEDDGELNSHHGRVSVKSGPLSGLGGEGSMPLSETHSVNSNKEPHSPVENGPVKRFPVDISSVTASRLHDESSHKGQAATRTVMVSVSKVDTSGQSRSPVDTVTNNKINNRTTRLDKVKENNANYRTAADIENHTSSNSNLKSIVDGVYWSKEAETSSPSGFTPQQTTQWRQKIENNKIIGVSEGCGRMQNRQLLLNDATKACARYRLNTDQIQGEVYSYYLSRVLGVSHVPPSVLVTTDPRAERWRRVNQALTTAQWSADKVAVVTPWIEDLQPAYIPAELRTTSRSLHPTEKDLGSRTPDDVSELVQWSDLIVFDYLTANLDRVVNNMYNEQWNPDMMRSPAHNLEKEPRSGHLVFLDNESGLFHSYRLLDKYSGYHTSLLKSLCVFRRQTAQRIKDLHESGRVGAEIMELFREEEPLYRYLPKLPDRTVNILQQRLADVHAQINHCEGLYNS